MRDTSSSTQPEPEAPAVGLSGTGLTLAQLLEQTDLGLVVKDLDGRYVFVSRGFERITGLSREAAVGRTTSEVFPPEIAGALRGHDAEVVAAGRTIVYEEIVSGPGGARTVLTSKFPVRGPDGAIRAICSAATDITERKRNEEALRRAALAVSTASGATVFATLVRQLADILGAGAALISVFFDARRTHMRALAACVDGRMLESFDYALAGSPCAGVIGQDFRYVREGVHREFAPGTLFAERGFDSYAAYSITATSGEQLGLIVVMDRGPLAECALAEAMLKIFAVRAAAEIERARADEALRVSEASYRAIFEAAEDGIFIFDPETGAILDVNPKACAAYGYTPEEMRRLAVDDLGSGVSPYTGADAARHLAEARKGRPVRIEWHRKNKDGSLHWDEVYIKAAVINDAPRIIAVTREITQRKRAEEALRASEEQYRAIFHGSADALVLRDAGFRIVDVNAAYEALSGRRREEVVGVDTLTLTAHDDPAKRRELHAVALAGRPIHFETEARRGDGTPFVIEVRGVPMSDRGRPHVLYMGRDVTENRLAERALRASEEQYRAIFTASADGIVLRDAQFRVVDINPAALAMVGKSRAEVIGRDRMVVVAETERERVRAMHRRVLAGASIRYEVEGVGADGRRMDLEIRLVPMQHQGLPHVLAIARDLTELRAVAEALRVSGEQYRAIFDAAVDALVLRDETFRIVDVNPAYEAMTGYSLAEVAGADYVVANPPEVDQRVKALHRRALAGEPVQLETQILARNGSRLEVELRGLPIRHQGKPHVLYVGRDITARKQAEEARLALEAQLRQAQKMEAIGHLTGGIAHDFNNILTSVMGYVGLASERESAGADAKLATYLEQALRSCRRARDLIQQMLVFSRGQRGERVPVDLAAVVDESSRLLRSTLPATLKLETELDAPLPRVSADRVQAEQVLLNLAINARDAMAGRGTLTVGLAHRRVEAGVCASCRKPVSGRFLVLSVSDTGPGIPPAVMDRMFEPFFSTKEVGKGSGMGLATVHGIVHDHGGHVLVESAPGHGTTFRVLLPMLDGVGSTGAPEAASSEPPRARQSLHGRVLVVDDEASVAAFMQELLAGWGLETTAATDASDALERLRSRPGGFDLVVTDLTMPGMTGIQLARAIAAIDPALPVILSTGYSDGVSEDALRGANIRALLRKPIETAALRSLVEAELSAPKPG
ncbi:MAG: PAS domain S-box protein [Burkholderiales bacterium]|nr:PAS domain S-box protein [Burkholderiales bacterium]